MVSLFKLILLVQTYFLNEYHQFLEKPVFIGVKGIGNVIISKLTWFDPCKQGRSFRESTQVPPYSPIFNYFSYYNFYFNFNYFKKMKEMDQLIKIVNRLQDAFVAVNVSNPIDLPQIVVIGR